MRTFLRSLTLLTATVVLGSVAMLSAAKGPGNVPPVCSPGPGCPDRINAALTGPAIGNFFLVPEGGVDFRFSRQQFTATAAFVGLANGTVLRIFVCPVGFIPNFGAGGGGGVGCINSGQTITINGLA